MKPPSSVSPQPPSSAAEATQRIRPDLIANGHAEPIVERERYFLGTL